MKKIIASVVIGLLVLLVAAVIVAGTMAGAAVKAAVESVGPQATGTAVTLAAADLSILSGKGSAQGFVVGNPEGFHTPSAVEVDSVAIRVDPGSLFSDTIVIDEIHIDGALVHWEGSMKGSNIARIQKNIEDFAGMGDDSAEAGQTRVVIRNLLITNTRAKVSMTMLKGKAAPVPVPDLHLTDIGEEDSGKTVGDVVRTVTQPIIKSVAEAVANSQGLVEGGSIADKVKSAGETVKEGVTGGLKGATDKVKGLLGR